MKDQTGEPVNCLYDDVSEEESSFGRCRHISPRIFVSLLRTTFGENSVAYVFDCTGVQSTAWSIIQGERSLDTRILLCSPLKIKSTIPWLDASVFCQHLTYRGITLTVNLTTAKTL